MNSRLLTAVIAHTRRSPRRNSFAYRAYFLLLDLAELDALDAGLKRFGHNRRALTSLRDSDHGPRDGSPLRPWIDELLSRARIDLEGGQVLLMTFPRVMGARFYPVSFWYCFHADGTPRAVLAEVQNTFRDHHNYLLHNNGAPFDWNSRPHATKAFYVSPFIRVDDVEYEFAFNDPRDGEVGVSIRDIVDGDVLLSAAISADGEEITDAGLLRQVLRHGPMSVTALVLIHWQALKLAFKRIRFYAHSAPPAEETSL